MKFTGERVVPDAMHANIDTYQSHLARYIWALPFCVNKETVDAACGTGYGSNILASVAKNVIGLDNDGPSISYAREHSKSNTNYLLDDLDNTIHVNHKWDLVVTFETIEHLDDPIKFMKWCQDTAPEVIGSIPVSCRTEFHKHTWTKDQILDTVHKIWPKAVFWFQDKTNIHDQSQGRVEQVLFRGIR